MKHLNNLLLRVSLAVAVLISLILSWLIWTNNAKYQQALPPSSKQQTISQRNAGVSKKMNEIFLPTKLLLTKKHQQYAASSNQANLITTTMNLFKTAKLDHVKLLSQHGAANYQHYLQLNNTLQLIYPTQLSINALAELINQRGIQQHGEQKINRIVVTRPTGKKRVQIFLLDDQKQAVYQVQQRKLLPQRLRKITQDASFTVPVTIKQNRKFKTANLDYQKPLRLSKVSYLIARQTNNTYVSNLLNSQQESDISTHKNGTMTTYRSGVNRSLVVDNKTNLVTYSDYSKTTVPQTMGSLFDQSFQILAKSGSSLNGLYFFSYNDKNKQLIFRNYVNGFPIFYPEDVGSVNVSYTTNAQRLTFSKQFLQVPLPTDQAPVQLPDTKTVIQKLTQAAYNPKNIQKILIGYTWMADDQNKQIVNLTPEYYVLMNNQWRSLTSWLNHGR